MRDQHKRLPYPLTLAQWESAMKRKERAPPVADEGSAIFTEHELSQANTCAMNEATAECRAAQQRKSRFFRQVKLH